MSTKPHTKKVAVSELIKPGGLLDRLRRECLLAHVDELADIAARGEVAIVVFEPDPSTIPTLRYWGWSPGEKPVYGMTRARMLEIANNSSDYVWQRWAARPSNAKCLRMFVHMHFGTMLFNVDERGYSMEPNQSEESVLA